MKCFSVFSLPPQIDLIKTEEKYGAGLFEQSSVHCPSHPTSRQRRLAIGWKNMALIAQIKTEGAYNASNLQHKNAMEWRNTNTNINTNTNTSTNKDRGWVQHSGEKAQIKTEEEGWVRRPALCDGSRRDR